MTQNPPFPENLDDPYTYTSPAGEGSPMGCVVLFGSIPAVGFGHELYVNQPLPVFLGGVGFAVVLLFALHVYLSTAMMIEIDSRGLRLTKQRQYGPYRGPVETIKYVSFAAVAAAREVRRHSPGQDGGWNASYVLDFGEHGTIEANTIPGDQKTGPFREMVKRVEAHLGDRFTLVEDFGPMTAAVNRQVAEAIAKNEPPAGGGA